MSIRQIIQYVLEEFCALVIPAHSFRVCSEMQACHPLSAYFVFQYTGHVCLPKYKEMHFTGYTVVL